MCRRVAALNKKMSEISRRNANVFHEECVIGCWAFVISLMVITCPMKLEIDSQI